MQKYTFICENPYDNSKLTYESHAEGLSTLLEDFTHFLRGSGFVINGLSETIPESDCSSEFATEVDYEGSYDYYDQAYDDMQYDLNFQDDSVFKRIVEQHEKQLDRDFNNKTFGTVKGTF
jgi:glycosidase